MKNQFCWISYKGRYEVRRYINAAARIMKVKYRLKTKFKKELIDLDGTQNFIIGKIQEGKLALIARFGSNEALITALAKGIDLRVLRKISDKALASINKNAGVFPYGQEMACRFGRISIDAAKQVDLLGAWDSAMQDYLIAEVCTKDVTLTDLGNLEPFFAEKPWTAALKGKKVLVVHPFKDTIEKQYKKRELLFENPNMLPEFELRVLRAVQTSAYEKDERFKDWEEALNYMFEEAMKQDFDVALIGCGAYGMPLAAKLKQSGKVAIHLGGCLQLFFGIKGNRWNVMPQAGLYNEHWIKPLEHETPKAAQVIEGACYW